MSKNISPSVAWRLTLATALAVVMTACGSDPTPVGTVGHVKGFAGTVAGDEPTAVLAARDVLSAGGNAADAAVTLYFSLAVTLPSTASLGGGGSCVVHNSAKRTVEVVDFPAPAVAKQGELAMAVPANSRGFFMLWARYGRLQWDSLLAAPERMARNGVAVSRALANDLAAAGPQLAADAEAQRLFFRPDGHTLGEGERMSNFDLATLYASLRRSPGDFNFGTLSRDLAASAQRAGGGLTTEEMRNIRPQFSAGIAVPIGDDTAVLAPARGDAGLILTAMAKRHAADRPQLVAERISAAAARQGAEGFRGYPPGAGFVVTDAFGTTVACGVSANGLFGSGRMAPGTGFMLAAPPAGDGVRSVPALLVNTLRQEVRFAGVASGGASPAAALSAALMAVADEGATLDKAATGGSGPTASRVNISSCGGIKPDFAKCGVATDAKGFGYAVVVGRD